MKIKRLGLYYLLAWGLYCLYVYLDNILKGNGSQPYVWSYLASSFIEFTFCFFIVYPRFFKRKRIFSFILGLIIAEAIYMGTRCLIEEVLYLWLLGHHNYSPDTTALYYIRDNWWQALQPILLSIIIWAFLNIYFREKETEQLRREKTQTELAFLKSQINPHFLYNTLNYLYSLAYPVSEKLGDAIIKLSGLMRYMLAESTDGMVELEKEIEYLHNYIAIYRMRFEDHFFVDFNIDGGTLNKRIASLALIPFVENAFKHGVMDDGNRPVKIQLKILTHQLIFTVSNKINRNQKDHSSGIGMTNIRRRLELIYPERYELLISDNGETYKAILTLNLAK